MSHPTSSPLVDDPYYSRLQSKWEAVERQDPVVWGSDSGPVASSQLADYGRDGYLALPQLISGEQADAYRRMAEQMAAGVDPASPGVICEPGDESTIRTIFRVHREGPLAPLCRDPRLVSLATQILGGPVYIHQSRINFKPPLNGKEFFWHSDFETWHVEDGMPRMRAVSISLNLTENTEFNGPLMVIPRSHELYVRCIGSTPEDHYRQSLKKQQYGVPCREALELLVERGGGIEAPKGAPGSAVAFECNTMHGSVGNLSPFPRINLFLVFNSVENRLVDPYGGRPPRPDFLAERNVGPLQGAC